MWVYLGEVNQELFPWFEVFTAVRNYLIANGVSTSADYLNRIVTSRVYLSLVVCSVDDYSGRAV
jgi:hypothetical protein